MDLSGRILRQDGTPPEQLTLIHDHNQDPAEDIRLVLSPVDEGYFQFQGIPQADYRLYAIDDLHARPYILFHGARPSWWTVFLSPRMDIMTLVLPPEPISAPAPKVTASPTHIPEATPTSTPSSTPLPPFPRVPCLVVDEWLSSWGGTSVRPHLPGCYNFDPYGFIAVDSGIHTGAFALQIIHERSGHYQRHLTHLIGADETLSESVVLEFSVQIQQIELHEDREELDHLDLIIGLGDPMEAAGGHFVRFRLKEENPEAIQVCLVNSALAPCHAGETRIEDHYSKRITTLPTAEAEQKKWRIELTRDGNILFSIEDQEVYHARVGSFGDRRLWIGWDVSHRGVLRAQVELNAELLSTEYRSEEE